MHIRLSVIVVFAAPCWSRLGFRSWLLGQPPRGHRGLKITGILALLSNILLLSILASRNHPPPSGDPTWDVNAVIVGT